MSMGTNAVSLDTLADQIRAKIDEVETAHRTTLERAREAGELLIRAKELVKHGQWLPWLEANCRVSADMAGKWMKLSRQWPELEASYSEQVPYLGVQEALKLLAKPREPKKPITIEGEAVEVPGMPPSEDIDDGATSETVDNILIRLDLAFSRLARVERQLEMERVLNHIATSLSAMPPRLTLRKTVGLTVSHNPGRKSDDDDDAAEYKALVDQALVERRLQDK